MKTITNDPNLPMAVTFEGKSHEQLVSEAVQAQEKARATVIDASDRVPAWDGAGCGAINAKSPDKHVHTQTETKAVSRAQGTEERKPFFK